jgi:hypothetical protein
MPLDVGFRTAQDAPRPPRRHGQRMRAGASVLDQIRRTSQSGGPEGLPMETVEVGRPPRSDPGHCGAPCRGRRFWRHLSCRRDRPERPTVKAPSSGPASSGLTLGALLFPGIKITQPSPAKRGPPPSVSRHCVARAIYVRRTGSQAVYVAASVTNAQAVRCGELPQWRTLVPCSWTTNSPGPSSPTASKTFSVRRPAGGWPGSAAAIATAAEPGPPSGPRPLASDPSRSPIARPTLG